MRFICIKYVHIENYLSTFIYKLNIHFYVVTLAIFPNCFSLIRLTVSYFGYRMNTCTHSHIHIQMALLFFLLFFTIFQQKSMKLRYFMCNSIEVLNWCAIQIIIIPIIYGLWSFHLQM